MSGVPVRMYGYTRTASSSKVGKGESPNAGGTTLRVKRIMTQHNSLFTV